MIRADCPYFIAKWGTQDFIKRYGPLNATLCWARAIEMELKDPVPKLRRPGRQLDGKVGFFPSGSVEKRSLRPEKAKELFDGLKAAGLNPELCPHCEKPEELANFVASCEYVVGVYTGPTHLAAAMGVKTLATPVGDSPFAYRPLQPNVHILCSSCDLCWTMKIRDKDPYCQDAMPLCQRVLTPERVLAGLRKLDSGRGGIELLAEQP